MFGDMTNSILEERIKSVILRSNTEDIINSKMVTITPLNSDVPVQYVNISGHHNISSLVGRLNLI